MTKQNKGASLTKWEISGPQAAWLVAGVVSMSGHVLPVTHFMDVGGRDAWMSGIFALPVAALAVAAQVSLSRRYPGKTLTQFLPKVLGILGYPIGVLYGIFYLAVLLFTLRTTTYWLVDTILPETPSWVMAAIYLAAVAYAALGGLDVLARVNQFTLPVLVLLGILVAVSTAPAKDYTLLLPMFEQGWGPIVAVSLLGVSYFGETSILAMITGYVRQDDRRGLLRNYLVALVFLMWVLTGPTAGSIATLGYRVAQNMPYPTFQHWLMVSFARFFERTDIFAVHQWLVGAYVRSGVFLLLGVQALLQSTRVKIPLKWGVISVTLLTMVLSELAWSARPDFDRFIRSIYLPACAVLGIAVPLLLWCFDSVRRLIAPGSKAQHGA